MIKTMISHASEDDAFVDWLYEKLDRENLGLDIFVDHKSNLPGDEAQNMIDEAKRSIIFIPVLSNCSVVKDFFQIEIRTAFDSQTTYSFPIKLNCDDDKIPPDIKIGFSKHNRVSGTICAAFSNRNEWDPKYERLREAIAGKLIELDIYRKDEFFYKDVEHIDLILKREDPTPSEIKTMVDVYRIKEAYQHYFFRKLRSLKWLNYLRPYGFFDRNPKPIEVEDQTGYYRVPRWSVLDYLEWCSRQIGQDTNSKYGEALIEIIRSVSQYRDEKGNRIDNHITDSVFIKIMANLPDRFIKEDDIELIGQFFDSRWGNTLVSSEIGRNLLPALLEHKQKKKALKILEIATSIRWTEENGENEIDPLMETYWLNDLFEKNINKIGDLLPIETAEVLIGRIAEITERKEIEFNTIQIPAIEDHPQNALYSDRFQNIVVRALRELLSSATKKDYEKAAHFLSNLFKRKHPIFKRLAISAVSTNWQTYCSLFHSFAGRYMLNDYALKHEVYILLRDHFSCLSEKEQDNAIEWIESGPDQKHEEGEDKQFLERSVASWKQDWLSALTPSGHAKAVELYERCRTITGTDQKHPDFGSWMEIGGVAEISPIGVAALLQMNNTEIAEYLNSYRDSGKGWEGPSKEGLEETFLQIVKTNPTKFDTDLEPFIVVPINYHCQLIRGFREAWAANKHLSWGNVLKFCRQVTLAEGFWERSCQEEEYNYRRRMLSEIADLLIEGTRDDARAFEAQHLPMAEKLILTMLDKTQSDLHHSDDLLLEVLNSPKGRLLSALVNYSLRVARLNKGRAAAVNWSENIKAEFTRRLDRIFDPSLEFSVTLGRYLPNLYYLDKEWIQLNINRIFPKEIEEHWQASMEGYLLEAHVYDYLYELLRMNGHYNKALGTKFRNQQIRKRLIQHICIGYLIRKEELADSSSPFNMCLTEGKPTDVLEMISFFWIQREYLSKHESRKDVEEDLNWLKIDQKERIIRFWGTIYERLNDKAQYSDEEKKILSSLGKLSCFLEKIDNKTLPWLKLSVRYIEKDFNSPFFIEYLNRLCDVNPREVSVVYLEMLNYSTPDYDKDNIKSIVEKLYILGQHDNADKICNIYGSRGPDFLRDIYAQHN